MNTLRKALTTLIRTLTAWAWGHEIEVADSMVKLTEMHAREGAIELHIEQNPALAHHVTACFATMLSKSPNYTECKFKLDAPDMGWITVLIRRGNGLTPHELRQQAEAERDKALEENRRLRDCLALMRTCLSACGVERGRKPDGTYLPTFGPDGRFHDDELCVLEDSRILLGLP